jgi:hypothetical protein
MAVIMANKRNLCGFPHSPSNSHKFSRIKLDLEKENQASKDVFLQFKEVPFLPNRFKQAKINHIDYERLAQAVTALFIVQWVLNARKDRIQPLMKPDRNKESIIVGIEMT